MANGDARVAGAGGEAVGQRRVEALGREADAAELLRRPAAMLPDAAQLAGRGVVDLAGLRRPHARAAVAAADLEHVRLLGMQRGHPVEAVAAEVHQPAAALDEALRGRRASASSCTRGASR